MAVQRYHGGLEMLLYSYAKANETDKRKKNADYDECSVRRH